MRQKKCPLLESNFASFQLSVMPCYLFIVSGGIMDTSKVIIIYFALFLVWKEADVRDVIRMQMSVAVRVYLYVCPLNFFRP